MLKIRTGTSCVSVQNRSLIGRSIVGLIKSSVA